MVYSCNGPRFEGLKNPYTGKPMNPKMSVSSSGRIRFFAPDTYTPAMPFPTAKDAYRAWNRVDGVEGLKDGQPVVCAYTGRALHLVHDADGYHYEGGFDSRMLFERSVFLYYAAMRGGVSEYPEPAPESRVDKPAEKGRTSGCAAERYVDEHKAELTEESVKTAEAIMQKHRGELEAATTVSMSVPRKPKGRK